MSRRGGVWIGADPGGKGHFGIAILYPDGHSQTWRVNCAEEAVGKIETQLRLTPKGAGVDAPLWWSSGPSGDRKVDDWLRTTFGLSGGRVQAVNSLRGAVLIQGVLFAKLLRKKYPKIGVTETHPKALLKALRLGKVSFAENFGVTFDGKSQHERDAVVSAVAAREGFLRYWKRDLAKKRGKSERRLNDGYLKRIHYFWPEQPRQ